MSQSCTSEPVSWLTLERRALGELDAAARARVDAHLASCGACAACARAIEGDRVVLRPLPVVATERRAARVLSWARWAVPALAAAAGVVLWTTVERGGAEGTEGVKGAGVAVVVVGPDGRARSEAAAGEALMVEVTCVPSVERAWDVVVYDGDGASFPLSGGAQLACGNQVVLPGALALDGRGGPATICVVLGTPAVPSRALLEDRARLPETHACTDVRVR